MIIDAHTHPPTNRDEWPGYLAALRHYGIDRAVTSCLHADWPPHPTPEQAREANALAAEFCAASEGRVLWLAYLNPHNDNWAEELERCLEAGACGIKLWISVKDPDGAHIERCYPILERAGRDKLPVLIHSANRTEPKFAGELNTAEVVTLARRFSQTKIIEAHAGSQWRRALGMWRGVDNLVVDICAYLPEREEVAEIVRSIGPDRALFGSDSYFRDLGAQLAKVYFSDVPTEVKEKILWRNAARVYGIPAPTSETRSPMPTPEPLSLDGLPDPAYDHFCFCGRWPFYPCEVSPEELEKQLAATGIFKAFVANADSILSENLLESNAYFADEAASMARVIPLATLDPTWPNWSAVLEAAIERFQGGWISPYYHQYRLDDPALGDFFLACANAPFPLWINCECGDPRWHHRAVAVRPVAKEELVGFAGGAPSNAYVFQGVWRDTIEEVLSKGLLKEQARFDVSRLTDFAGHLAAVVEKHGAQRLVFGSEFPLRHLFTTRWVAKEAMALAKGIP